ncbi:MAG: OmpA family protein [Bacteroidales bacterium]|nr:OmpA family protein [Bacteroidales bacterium]
MRKSIYLIFSSVILNFISLKAQNIEFKSSKFKNQKDDLKIAISNIKQGDEFLKKGIETLQNNDNLKIAFTKALEFYFKANDFNPNNAELNYKIGKCLLQTPEKTASIQYLVKAIDLDPDVNPEVYFLLGQAYKYDYKFNEAKLQFKKYKGKLSDKEYQKESQIIKKEISECNTAFELVENPVRVWIDNLQDINTEYPDYNAAISADEYVMIFNSKNPNTTGGKKDKNNDYFSDIYITYNHEGKWQKPEKIGEPFITDGQDECLAMSPDGQRIFISKDNSGNIDLFVSELEGDTWSAPKILAEDRINTSFNETHASFSYNGIKIYFISDNPYSNKGGTDMFFSGRINTRFYEAWGKASTVGSEVNTRYDEGCIFMHPDGKTMYFSSKGHNSMGGYDIFKSVRLPGRWSKPENMGYPVNTPYDEKYFVMSASGKHAYVTSNRKEDNFGDFDIYKITFLGPVKPMMIDNEDHLLANFAQPIQEGTLEGAVEIESKNLTVLKGRILDEFTSEPVKAEIEIVDNKRNEIIATFNSNSKTGKFLVSLPAGVNYGIAVKAPDYLFYSENFNLPKTSDYQLIDKDIYLQNVCIGCKIVLRNVFFDTGKFNLRPESTPELERLYKLLKDIPRIKVEISGHTDNVGSESLNQQLSENRAKTVVMYLKQKGIAQNRMVYKGYGSAEPVATNETKQGRQLNRRTEFKILEN